MATYTDQLVVYSAGSLKRIGNEETVEIHGIELTSSVTVPEGGLTLGSTAVTSTAAELNILDGVTATASEINILDGVTATATELNYLAGVTLGTSAASKVVTADSSGNVVLSGNLTVSGTTTTISSTNTVVADKLFELGNGTTGAPSGDAGIIIERGDSDNAIIAWDESADIFVLGTTTATGASTGDLSITAAGLSVSALTLGGTAITSTAAELNILDGVTASAAELNLLDGVTATTAELNILDGVTASASELNILDGDTSATSITVVDADRIVMNDGGTMLQVAASTLKTYFQSNVTATAIAADDITAGDAAVEITTTSGDVVIDAPSGQSVDLQVAGSNVIEVAGDEVIVSQKLMLSSSAGISLPVKPANAAIASGDIIALEIGGGPSTGVNLADANDGTGTIQIPAGVALAAVNANIGSNATLDCHTISGAKITVNLAGTETIDFGAPVYLSTTAGKATGTVPTEGYVYEIGFTLEVVSSASTASILWRPQFIADLG